MIPNQDRMLLFHFVQSPTWQIVQNVANEIINQIQTNSKRGSTLDEIAIHAINADGQMEGIKRLLQELSTFAHEHRGADHPIHKTRSRIPSFTMDGVDNI